MLNMKKSLYQHMSANPLTRGHYNPDENIYIKYMSNPQNLRGLRDCTYLFTKYPRGSHVYTFHVDGIHGGSISHRVPAQKST